MEKINVFQDILAAIVSRRDAVVNVRVSINEVPFAFHLHFKIGVVMLALH